MNESFAFSDLCRRVANLIRIGKVAEVNGAQVKVRIGEVITGWLQIISMAGDTSVWIPITVGEQVAVFSPYGEMAQSFVIRSIHYNKYAAPESEDADSVLFKTKTDVDVSGESFAYVDFKDGITFTSGESSLDGSRLSVSGGEISASHGENSICINDDLVSCRSGVNAMMVSDDRIELRAGNASITLSSDGIQLKCGGSTIDLSDSGISLNSSNISTTPPVCKCEGGV
jgi:phage baseplate assembly protein gpV